MKAVIYDETDGPKALRIEETEDPVPGRNQVSVRVEAAGVNPYDFKVLDGTIPIKADFPRRIGGDLAGTIVAVGEGATYWDGTAIKIGDEVMGRGNGTVAERALASETGVTPRPDGLSVEAAGGMNVPALTAVSCLATVPIGPEDIVLVGGASGAVGMMVTQLAIEAGAKVIGSTSEHNFDFVRSLGAEPVEYGPGLADRVLELGTVSAVIDCHGRDALDAGVALGVPADRMVAIAAYAALDELGVHNVEREARTMENLASVAQKVADGQFVYPVVETFPLERVQDAFEAVGGSHAPGKIVVTPQ